MSPRSQLLHNTRRTAADAAPAPRQVVEDNLEPLWDGFESEAAARAEDEVRIKGLARAALIVDPSEPDGGVAREAYRQHHSHIAMPMVHRVEFDRLRNKLLEAQESGTSCGSLASSVTMRRFRHAVIPELLEATESYPDDGLKTLTVIKRAWAFTPVRLHLVDVAVLKNQMCADLKRYGISSFPGPLVGFFHGEFEPTSGLFVLHIHFVTTPAKAAFMIEKLGKLKGYRITRTKAPAIKSGSVNNRAYQFGYLLKAFWPERTVRMVNGKARRDRNGGRIDEPFHSLSLLWLDRQKLSQMAIMNNCWSPRYGGPQAMHKLYLTIQAAS